MKILKSWTEFNEGLKKNFSKKIFKNNPKLNSKIKENLILHFEECKDAVIEAIAKNKDLVAIINAYEKDFETKIREDIYEELNISQFFRTLNRVLSAKPSKHKADKIFNDFIKTIDDRVDHLLELIEKEKLSKHSKIEKEEDILDDETSIIKRSTFEDELYDLQVELLKMEEWVMKEKKKVVLVFEGRDSSGKGSTIKRIVDKMNPKGFRIVALGIPTKEEMQDANWFKRYEAHMPKEGEIVIFDRSWYGMGITNPVMGYCSKEQYNYFMKHVNAWERNLTEKQDIKLLKFWLSIDKEKQDLRFNLRKESPLKYWKFSENDLKSMDKWDLYTEFINKVLSETSTKNAPWIIVTANDKKIARLNVIRQILSKFNYPNKSTIDMIPYPEVIQEL